MLIHHTSTSGPLSLHRTTQHQRLMDELTLLQVKSPTYGISSSICPAIVECSSNNMCTTAGTLEIEEDPSTILKLAQRSLALKQGPAINPPIIFQFALSQHDHTRTLESRVLRWRRLSESKRIRRLITRSLGLSGRGKDSIYEELPERSRCDNENIVLLQGTSTKRPVYSHGWQAPNACPLRHSDHKHNSQCLSFGPQPLPRRKKLHTVEQAHHVYKPTLSCKTTFGTIGGVKGSSAGIQSELAPRPSLIESNTPLQPLIVSHDSAKELSIQQHPPR
ncbi:hypothetical protein F511_12549 [Dorcoceras hygrometricum]|uniref:Uncharacterized protein n=1 Tax=Dorcoceras hygrometricum TaxID=472368 RepID=A0A2Z7BRA4_9LAMI|nr:hypothetical protein F511_12549 [Dorcoceras hygrometricum]